MAVDEAQHINARREVGSWQLGVSSWQFIAEQFVTENIEDLEGAFAVDDEVAVADEGKRLTGPTDGLVCGKHQLEAAFIVRDLAIESVARRDQKVNVVSSKVVDKVKVI